MRPMLTEAEAARFGRARVLAGTDGWDPAAELTAPPEMTIKPGAPGAVQAAVEAAIAAAREAGRAGRIRLALAPGLHRGLVVLPDVITNAGRLRFTLTGPREAVLAEDIDAEMTGPEFRARFQAQCAGASPETRAVFDRIAGRAGIITTANAAVLRIEAPDTAIHGLTIRNLYNCDRASATVPGAAVNAAGQAGSGQHQAVALFCAGADRLTVRGTRLIGFQDTLYLQGHGARAFLQGCEIEGDVDFIFGQATARFERCEIRSLGSRADMSWATAPATDIRTPAGFVFDDCDFTHDGSERALGGRFQLGRQWFEGVRATPYGTSPVDGFSCHLGAVSAWDPPRGTISRQTLQAVGKCVVLNSRIGRHIHPRAPWGDWNGGDADPLGRYRPAPWHPRFRPVQMRAGDFLDRLGPWLAAEGLDYGDLDPEEPWLGEWNSTPGP